MVRVARIDSTHPAGMSGSDVIAFSHARGGADYRPSELAFLYSRKETGLFLRHGSSSEFRADTRDMLEDSLTRGVIHLNIVHEIRKWGLISRSARVNLVIRPGVDLRRCGFTADPVREVDVGEEDVRRDLDVGLGLDYNAVSASGFNRDGGQNSWSPWPCTENGMCGRDEFRRGGK